MCIRDRLRADTYQDLVNNILILVGNHAESGTIWLYYDQELSLIHIWTIPAFSKATSSPN